MVDCFVFYRYSNQKRSKTEKMRLSYFYLFVTVGAIYAQCPDEDDGLALWSDPESWASNVCTNCLPNIKHIQNPNTRPCSNKRPYASFQKKSQLLLCRLRLSRITGYLEEKIWPLFKHGNLTSANKILWIRGGIAPQEQFLPFSTLFSIYISNQSLIT